MVMKRIPSLRMVTICYLSILLLTIGMNVCSTHAKNINSNMNKKEVVSNEDNNRTTSTNNNNAYCPAGEGVCIADDYEGEIIEAMSRHHMKRLLFAGGTVGPFYNQFNITSHNMKRTQRMLYHAINPIDLIVFFIIGFAIIPFLRLIYDVADIDEVTGYAYDQSYMYNIAKLTSQAARIAILVYIIDCLILIALCFGLNGYKLEQLSHIIAKVVYIIWIASRISLFKRFILAKIFAIRHDQLGRVSIIDRLLDGILYAITASFILDVFDMEMGSGIKSMFAFGSASTLMVGLASRDLASMFASGLVLSTTDRVNEGDQVQFGNGISGVMVKIGWTHSTIRNADNLLEVVPNSELGMQRVKNLSRVTMCRVQQNLRFSYNDIDILSKVCIDIINEIKIECSPKVIIDGSKPLRAVFVNYREDYLHVIVQAHFHEKPIGNDFFIIQEKCLYAINKAVKKNSIKFVTSFYPSNEPLNK